MSTKFYIFYSMNWIVCISERTAKKKNFLNKIIIDGCPTKLSCIFISPHNIRFANKSIMYNKQESIKENTSYCTQTFRQLFFVILLSFSHFYYTNKLIEFLILHIKNKIFYINKQNSYQIIILMFLCNAY